MANGADIAVKLKEQGELYTLRIIGALYQHAIGIQRLLQDFRAEPLRDQGDLQITAVAVVGVGTEIDDAVRIERGAVTFGIQADADSAGNRLRRSIGV